jgi:hypothetical protein
MMWYNLTQSGRLRVLVSQDRTFDLPRRNGLLHQNLVVILQAKSTAPSNPAASFIFFTPTEDPALHGLTKRGSPSFSIRDPRIDS